ncbi:PLP-dependent transferase [Flavobacterium amniphilum]|uniref:PLP-dependent transferase n=1 Tax=Flavobacterium amniphilum TaxID=1834035 RepID=UPI00202A3D59|nr:PLP-dependent transferase [Flavobacterium amniphilum]MCL9806750.1 PLP-dependent transferase [Flavobacterium amniphilum]
MSEYLCHIPCGAAVPFNNPHAVSVSLPTLDDVIAYEEGDDSVVGKMQSGYPRFFRNKWVQRLVDYVTELHDISPDLVVLPITSLQAYEVLVYLINERPVYIEEDGNVFLLFSHDDERIQQIKDFIRNAGLIISSRQAESTLLKIGFLSESFVEERVKVSGGSTAIISVLSDAYNAKPENVILTNSGANAFFAVCEALVSAEKSNEKNVVVQLGWLYVDTMEVIQKRSQLTHLQVNVHDLGQLEDWLKDNHASVSVVITEVVSNPKIQCVDIIGLHAICEKYKVKLVLDTTLITPFNAPILKYCDVAVESLSKFACGKGDVLMGAVIVSETSGIDKEIFERFVVPPYKAEVDRLGFQISDYEKRVLKSSENTKRLIEVLSRKKAVKKVWSVLEDDSEKNYRKINNSGIIPGLLTIEVKENISKYYDLLKTAKGPSLGTDFTLVMPYVYLAHYDLTKTEEGVRILNEKGMSPDILRVSVGNEAIEDIIKVFDEVFPD